MNKKTAQEKSRERTIEKNEKLVKNERMRKMP